MDAGDAFAINEVGQFVGWQISSTGNLHASLWGSGEFRDLTVRPGTSRANAINDAGQIVGNFRSDELFSLDQAVLWTDGAMFELTDLGGPNSSASAINNAGQIVGWATHAAGQQRAVLWDDGEITDLGTLGGRMSAAQAINEAGQIVGWAQTAAGGRNAVLWES